MNSRYFNSPQTAREAIVNTITKGHVLIVPGDISCGPYQTATGIKPEYVIFDGPAIRYRSDKPYEVAEMFRLFVGLGNIHMALDRLYG